MVLYGVGEQLSKWVEISIVEPRYILPVVSLVFFDYYLNFFSGYFLKLDVIHKQITTADGRINKAVANIKLSYHGNKSIHFKPIHIKIKKMNHSTTIYNDHEFILGSREWALEKNTPAVNLKIECYFVETPIPTISLLKSNIYFFNMKMHYQINYNTNKFKRIFFFKRMKKQ